METKILVKIMLAVLLAGFLISLASAQELPLILTINKDVFIPGDTLIISAVVHNLESFPTRAFLEVLITNEKETYPTALTPFEIQLAPNETKTVQLYNILVDENFTSDKYIVEARLLFDKREITSKVLEFYIQGTLNEMEVDINLCKNSACTEKTKVFVLNKDIYLDYASEVSNPKITAVLTYPDETTRQITIPISIKASQIGSYELKITASKEGYKTITKTEQFAVIEKEPDIRYKEEIEEIPWWLYPVIAFVIVAAVIIMFREKLFKKKNKKKRGKI